jgi:hypothetical protein
LSRLAQIWASKGDRLAKLLPHQLFTDADKDFGMDIEVNTILTARVCLVTLQIHTCTPERILSTGWNLACMNRLKTGLAIYVEGTPLSNLRISVNHICEMLQQIYDVNQSPQGLEALVTQDDPLASSLGSSIGTQQSSVFDQSLASSFGSNTIAATMQTPQQGPSSSLTDGTPVQAIPGPLWTRMTTSEGKQVAPPPDLNENSNVASTAAGPAQDSAFDVCMDDAPAQRMQDACRNMVDGKHCKFGPSCRYSHATVDIARTRAERRIAELRTNGVAELGPQAQQGFVPARTAPLGPNDATSQRLCFAARDRNWCPKASCRFFHPPNTHTSTEDHTFTTSSLDPNAPRFQPAPVTARFSSSPSQDAVMADPVDGGKSQSQAPCKYEKNMGFCKKKDKGCRFLHNGQYTNEGKEHNANIRGSAAFKPASAAQSSTGHVPPQSSNHHRGHSRGPGFNAFASAIGNRSSPSPRPNNNGIGKAAAGRLFGNVLRNPSNGFSVNTPGGYDPAEKAKQIFGIHAAPRGSDASRGGGGSSRRGGGSHAGADLWERSNRMNR